MLPTLLAAALAGTAAAAPSDTPAGDSAATARILTAPKSLPEGERSEKPNRALLEQPIVLAGVAILDLTDAEEDAFRNLHRMDRHAPLYLAHWLRADAGGEPRHLGWMYCAVHVKMMKGQIADCFRDEDGDGRFDRAATFVGGVPIAGALRFEPIPPVPYHLAISRGAYPVNLEAAVGTMELRFTIDETSGRLRFAPRAVNVGFRATADLEPAVEIDPKSLPVAVEIAGAKLDLQRWDGQRLTYRIAAPMASRPFELEPGPGAGYLIGHAKGWRMRIYDVALPAAEPGTVR
ncbi:MAG: hypothetical protein QOE79_1738 [Sphingomonadales bacterium]|nr:hypothetical protein [Sphingomonadales bacterium]MEA3050472.1 hypothetical protein [Sphingomonadales bacterium]